SFGLVQSNTNQWQSNTNQWHSERDDGALRPAGRPRRRLPTPASVAPYDPYGFSYNLAKRNVKFLRVGLGSANHKKFPRSLDIVLLRQISRDFLIKLV